MTSWGGMVRRSSGEVTRKEDEWPKYPTSNKNGITIFVEHALLKKIAEESGRLPVFIRQLDQLQGCASLEFYLGEYESIAAILNSLNVPVYIRKGIIESSHNDFFDDMKEKWGSNLEKDLPGILELSGNSSGNSSSRLRGRYLRDTKIIELFPEEMEAEAKGDNDKVDDVTVMDLLITTLAHETMHAYFDRPGHEKFPYAYFVEEPLAEFGMLVYMNETGMPDEVRKWAYNDVNKKHSCYRFGADLYRLHNAGDKTIREYLKKYKIGVGKYDVLDIDGGKMVIWKCPVSGKKGALKVTLPSGIIIQKQTAADTFALAIYEAICQKGLSDFIKRLSEIKAGKPLISKDSAVHGKYRSKKPLGTGYDGYYIDTDSNNEWRKKILERISTIFELGWEISID